jgi:hypothetical protein
MALAVLQFHGSPWLDPAFQTKDLLFLTQNLDNSTPLFSPAYISHSFINNSTAPTPKKSESIGRKLAKNPYIFALGVALLELSYGESLLLRAQPDELDAQGLETPNTEMLVASRLIKDIRNRELNNYALATASCIQCDMGYPFDYSLNDDGFRAKFIERVLGPLRDDCKEIFPDS